MPSRCDPVQTVDELGTPQCATRGSAQRQDARYQELADSWRKRAESPVNWTHGLCGPLACFRSSGTILRGPRDTTCRPAGIKTAPVDIWTIYFRNAPS